MKVDFEIDTVKILTEELRKSLSEYNDPAAIAVKLSLIKQEVNDTSRIKRLFNKYSANNE